MFSSLARHAQSLQESIAIMHAFQIAGDDAHISHTREISNIIGRRQTRFIATRDRGLRIHATLFERALDRHDNAA